MARISDRVRQQVEERAQGRCEYCQTQQVIVVSMEIDHIIPESVGGETVLENLCLACIGCNGFKLDFLTGLDPETEVETSLFNPRTQDWYDHFQWLQYPCDAMTIPAACDLMCLGLTAALAGGNRK